MTTLERQEARRVVELMRQRGLIVLKENGGAKVVNSSGPMVYGGTLKPKRRSVLPGVATRETPDYIQTTVKTAKGKVITLKLGSYRELVWNTVGARPMTKREVLRIVEKRRAVKDGTKDAVAEALMYFVSIGAMESIPGPRMQNRYRKVEL